VILKFLHDKNYADIVRLLASLTDSFLPFTSRPFRPDMKESFSVLSTRTKAKFLRFFVFGSLGIFMEQMFLLTPNKIFFNSNSFKANGMLPIKISLTADSSAGVGINEK